MPEKGVSNNPAGKPKGATNKANRPLKENIADFLNKNWKKIENDISKLDPHSRVQAYEKLIAYVLPKQKAVDANLTVEQRLAGVSDDQLNKIIDSILSGNGA